MSCANCGRPICYECMISAHVGFWCPECVAAQSAADPRARVVTRGQIRTRWGAAGTAPGQGGLTATTVLLAVNVLFFLAELAFGARSVMSGAAARVLLDLGALYVPSVLVEHEYWRLITSTFLHGSLLHLVFNMWALWVLGGYMEAALGRLRFLALYFGSGLAGSVLVLIAAPVGSLVVGASGAIYGLFGALAVHAYLNRGRDVHSRAILGNVVFLLAINLAFTFLSTMISWQAHIGGLLAGAALTYTFMLGGRREPRGKLAAIDLVAMLILAAVLVALTYWRVSGFTA